MIRLRNSMLLMLRFLINTMARAVHHPFRLEFDVHAILEKNFKTNAPFHFIQVGAHDGVSFDALYDFVKKRNSNGLVIEPIRDYYSKLVANYQYNKNIVAVNKAVHAYDKKVILYRVRPEKEPFLPQWAPGIASLDPEHHKRSSFPSDYIVSEEADAEHLMALLEKHYPADSIDLIQIDVEGYDYEVLKMLDFTRFRPAIIRLEIMNLPDADQHDVKKLLRRHRYFCFFQNPDLIAVQLHLIKL